MATRNAPRGAAGGALPGKKRGAPRCNAGRPPSDTSHGIEHEYPAGSHAAQLTPEVQHAVDALRGRCHRVAVTHRLDGGVSLHVGLTVAWSRLFDLPADLDELRRFVLLTCGRVGE